MPLSLVRRCLILALLTVAGMALGVGGALWFTSPAPFEVQSPAASPAAFVEPNASLAPDDVVRLQLAALQAYRADDNALLQCFALASPANRAMTGPLDHFASIVGGDQYRAMILARQTVVGAPVFHGRQASVFVTVIDQRHGVWVYRFFLSKQRRTPYVDCWMTDAVAFEGELAPPGEQPAEDDVALIPGAGSVSARSVTDFALEPLPS